MPNKKDKQQFFVSPQGCDDNPGTVKLPFKTIQRAQQAARAVRDGNVSITLAEGWYHQNTSLIFTAEDSCCTYRAQNGAKVIISGGMKWEGPWYNDGDLLYSDLDLSNNYYFKNLYIEKEKRQRARIPKYNPEQPNNYFTRNGRVSEFPKTAFKFKPEDVPEIKCTDDVLVNYFQMWVSSIHWIEKIDRKSNTIIFSDKNFFDSINYPYFLHPRGRYYLENAFEFLDSPGEWYFDRQISRLYYFPLKNENASSLAVTIPLMSKLIIVKGLKENPVRQLSFEGISFMHTDWNVEKKSDTEIQAHEKLGDAVIYAEFAHECSWNNCEISLGGAHGIFLDKGCRNNTISKCHIHNLGGGGVYIGPHGWKVNYTSPENEEVEKNTVENCFIHNLSHFFHGSCNVWIGCSSYNTVAHNEISDNDYCGISVGWSWTVKETTKHCGNIIEKNHVHHLGRGEISDFGGIYTLGLSPGTVVRDNVVHHIFSHGKSWGIYLDEGSREIEVTRNLTFKTSDRSFLVKDGPNRIYENIFAYPENEVIDFAGDEHGGARVEFISNIVLTDTMGCMKDLINMWQVDEIYFNNNLYWDVSNNELFKFHGKVFEQWQEEGFDVDSLIADPKFSVNKPQNITEFVLNENSPAYKLGYDSDPKNPINFSRTGLYGDDAWKSLPAAYKPRYLDSVYKRLDETYQ